MSKNKKLFRSQKDFILGGVCGGIAEYFEVDSMLIRLIAAILIFSGVGFLIYIFMWIILPIEGYDDKDNKKTVKLEKDKKTNEYKEKKSNNFREFLGLLLIIIGLLLFLGKIFYISPEMIGISMMIIVGILLLVTSSN